MAELNGWPSWVLLGKPFLVLMAPSSRYPSSFLTFDICFFCFCLTIFVLQSLLQDQDVLFGPHEAQFTAIAEANLKRKEDELAQTQVVLTYEKEQRALTEVAL